MSKFKIGDKVRILDGKNIKNYTSGWFDHMKIFVGRVDTIADGRVIDGKRAYRLKEHHFWWDERGLELVLEPWKVVIKPTSDTTTVGKLYCGSKLVKEVTTKKHPDDEYNRDEAIRVICDRLVGEKKEEPQKPKYYNGKMVCVDDGHLRSDYTIGKIYTVVNGRFRTDRGELYPPMYAIENIAEWNERSAAEWIEVVEE